LIVLIENNWIRKSKDYENYEKERK